MLNGRVLIEISLIASFGIPEMTLVALVLTIVVALLCLFFMALSD
jgi:hypothetical protein